MSERRANPLFKTRQLVGAMVVFAVALLLAPSWTVAQEASGGSEATETTLPDTLSPQIVRDLVARLSDDDVRDLLINQLDKVAASQPAEQKSEIEGYVDNFEAGAANVRDIWGERVAAMPQLVGLVPFFFSKLFEGRTATQIALTVIGVAAVFGIGVLAERLFLHFTANQRSKIPAARVERFTTCLGHLLQRLVWQVVALIVFTAGALVAFFALYQGQVPTRVAVMTYLSAIVIARLMSVISRFLLAPSAPSLRLIPLSDGDAHSLHRWIMAVVYVGAFGFSTANLLQFLGYDPAALDAFQALIGLAFIVLILVGIWRARKPISSLVTGEPPVGTLRRLTANWWHILAILFVFGIWLTAQIKMATGGEVTAAAAITSLLLVVALPLADIALRRLATDHFEARRLARAREAADQAPELDADGVTDGSSIYGEGEEQVPVPQQQSATDEGGGYEPAILKGLRVILWLGAFLVFTRLWDIDIYTVTQSGIGDTAAGALFNVTIIVLLAYLGWEVIKATIDRQIAAEGGPVVAEAGGEGGGQGASRLRTLLPLARKGIFATLVVMVAMTILSSLGVNIGPLLAGAGVVGLAIGFGAQTLVRDIVSGVFFLLDDAFRVGEYIDLGNVKGTVEKISIRSMQLRHHRGALNTIPFGEIQYLTNYSRDWVIMKLQFRVTYDTDVMQVKKIFKKINAELMENPEIAPNLLDPLKSQGVLSMEDSAMIIRAKFTAKPGEQFIIRREVYAKVQKAFDEAGIKFAHREVTVHVPEAAAVEEAAPGTVDRVAGAAARRLVEDEEAAAAAAGPAKATA